MEKLKEYRNALLLTEAEARELGERDGLYYVNGEGFVVNVMQHHAQRVLGTDYWVVGYDAGSGGYALVTDAVLRSVIGPQQLSECCDPGCGQGAATGGCAGR